MTRRGSDNLPRRFARLYTAVITDVMDEMGLLRQTLPHTIRPLTPEMRLAGYAFPARGRRFRGGPRDRDATLRRFLTMLGAVPADSVLVLAANDSEAAHFGELSAECFTVVLNAVKEIPGAAFILDVARAVGAEEDFEVIVSVEGIGQAHVAIIGEFGHGE